MTRLAESSSSSDEEEDSRLAQLREATVTLDNLKCEAKREEERNSKAKRSSDQSEEPFLLDVSPEFQEFVAKKLRSKLDESISWVTIEKSKKTSLTNDDFKLEILKNVYIDLNQKSEEKNTENDKNPNVDIKKHKEKSLKKKKSKVESSDSESDEKLDMLKEAAIDADFILKSSCIDQHKNLILK